jgi:uncharacterized protein YndB with AHSA1/START domain
MSTKHVPAASNEIVLERAFRAPRQLVFQAITTPALIKRWAGGKRAVVTAAEVDLKVGGAYRTAYRTHQGHQFAFVGVYREVSDTRLVHTEQMEGQPGEALVTITLTEQGAETTMRTVMAFESKAVRDSVAQTGMADGALESYAVLEGLLAEL